MPGRGDFNLTQCNPFTLKQTKTTCLPDDMLERLRGAWNVRYPTDKIPAAVKRKESLWAALRAKLQKQFDCQSEYCAVKELGDPDVKAGAAAYFRPEKPDAWKKDPRDWHDTLTIAAVMEQYEKAFPQFEFIGPVPIDFDTTLSFGKCVADELCKLDLAAVRAAGDTSIGIVFNLDPHTRPGSHWVCAFVDLVKGAAYYYDSYGYPPCPEIRRLLRRCREQGCQNIFWNDIRHQRKKSECGTYCMYVLLSLLSGRTFTEICKNPVPDDTMNALRDILYATERPRDVALTAAMKLLRL
jgi:hypothetical protein